MKMKAGKLYDANYDKELLAERAACADLIFVSIWGFLGIAGTILLYVLLSIFNSRR